MGVQGLWELLAPVGRRVSVETLSGKKLAIDASIWMVQFMKAMRDEKGEMVRNAHLIGFFRRICKLLFLRTKPVFIFDGGTPSLKRRTVIARRRQRDNAQSKIRKTAEKLLINHLKAMRVKELADSLKNQRKENDLKAKGVVIKNIDLKGKSVEVTEKEKDFKGKSVVTENVQASDNSSKSDDSAVVTSRFDQETLDGMLAASLAEEEDGSVTGNASTSVQDDIVYEEDDDEEEEMVLPVIDGKVDPAILAALPPSMQLDLLVQMRERLMAENRQKYQKVKKAPAKFSELQIQSYLKTVAFRREINEVQKSAAGKGMGGVQTSRIASEANREYIFSSSFTGDKQTLRPAGIEKNGDVERQKTGSGPACLNSANRISCVALHSSEGESGVNGPISDLNDVETYVDERGRLRLSRGRAMGIHMTRDLQRNLDLMKEIHQDKDENPSENREVMFNKIVLGDPETFSVDNHQLKASNEGNGIMNSFNDCEIQSENPQVLENRTALNISFFEDEVVSRCTDDDGLFAQLVAGSSAPLSSGKNDFSGEHPSDAASDCSWEEGIIDGKGVSFSNDVAGESRMTLEEGNINEENEVAWEEVVCDATENNITCSTARDKTISRVSLAEEADMAEAIRRSLEDFTREKSMFTSFGKEYSEISRETLKQNTVIPDLTIEKEEVFSLNLSVESDTLPSQIPYAAGVGLQKLENAVINNNPQIIKSPVRPIKSSTELETWNNKKATPMHKSCEENLVTKLAVLSEATSESGSVCNETLCEDPVSLVEVRGIQLIADQGLDKSLVGGKKNSVIESKCSNIRSHVYAAVMDDRTELNLVHAHQNDSEAAPTSHPYETTGIADSLEEPSTKELASSAHIDPNLAAENNFGVPSDEIRGTEDYSTIQNNMDVPIEVLEASLEEEMLNLRQERIDLGDEQRKLERNAESVSSEMFAECQELLQMFGLPYIIAPMEAEAQCAYLESAELVDGVVTDDSDVFLFGARSVYKNIFDDRKYVETYFMKDIESELGLTREQLIRMALLLGSDYTEGVSGIGIVNAIEVVNAFPEEDGLQIFREWLESPDPTILGTLDSQTGFCSMKRRSNASNSDADCSKEVVESFAAGGNVSEGHDNKFPMDNIQKTKQFFMDKHRNVSKNWHIPSSFPSEAVVSAYVAPQVDKSTESFSWGKPDLFVLRKLCWEKFGWNNQRADDLLVPVLKEYNKHETQLRLEAFYTFNERFAKIRSQRIKKALKGITGKKSSAVMDDLPKEASKKRMSPSGPDRIKENSNVEEDSIAESECCISEKPAPKKSRRRKIGSTPVSNEVGPSIQKEDRPSAKTGSIRNVRGRSRGRGRGRGRAVGRGRGIEVPVYESTEMISSDRRNSNAELERHGKTEIPYDVRKSTRPRKNINYRETDSEPPVLSKSVNQSGIKGMEGAVEQEPVFGEGLCRDPSYVISEKDGELFLNDGCHSDHLEIGGGFCLDEDTQENATVELVSTSTRFSGYDKSNLSLEDGFSGDYPAMRDGFCLDEVEPDNEPVQPLSSSTADLDDVITGRMINDLPTTQSLDPPSCIGVCDATNVGVLLEDRPQADSSTIPTTGLTAIPFLRRKRRKT